MEDSEIIELFLSKSESALSAIKEKYDPLCKSIAFNILKNFEDAEECMNDVYIALWQRIPETPPKNLKAYVCRISRNISISRLKYNKAKKRSKDLSVSLSEARDVLYSDDAAVHFDEVGKAISDFLRTQKREEREVFIRRYWFMDSVKEIAYDCGLSEGKVYSSIFRIKTRLKKFLKKEGIDI